MKNWLFELPTGKAVKLMWRAKECHWRVCEPHNLTRSTTHKGGSLGLTPTLGGMPSVLALVAVFTFRLCLCAYFIFGSLVFGMYCLKYNNNCVLTYWISVRSSGIGHVFGVCVLDCVYFKTLLLVGMYWLPYMNFSRSVVDDSRPTNVCKRLMNAYHVFIVWKFTLTVSVVCGHCCVLSKYFPSTDV